MRRLLLTVFALMFLPASAMAMTPLSDTALSSVTGQAGVNINPDVTLNLTFETFAWGDADGITPGPYNPGSWGASADGGYFGLRGLSFNSLSINARTDDTYEGYAFATDWKPITIDVATGGAYGSSVTFLRLGLGANKITADSIDGMFSLAAHSGFAGNLDQDLLGIHIGDLGIYINPSSYIDICNNRGPSASGITFTLDVAIDQWNMSALSFGDRDGLQNTGYSTWFGYGADTTQGWIGFKDFSMSNFLIKGTVNIDVVHTASGQYAAYGPTTVVEFRFTDCSLELSQVTAELALGNTPSLHSSLSKTMCDFYMADASLQVNGWMDVWAH